MRHVTFLFQLVKDGENEATDNSLSKRIFDLINGKNLISSAISMIGRNVLVMLVYDDA